MRRATGRHNQSVGDVYTEHAGIAAPLAQREQDRRRERFLFLGCLVVLPLLVMVLLAEPAVPYWGQPDQRAVITAAVADGTITESKTTCDASRFMVRGPAGRLGSFRDCDDERAVGDEVTVRWRAASSSEVQVDVVTFPVVLGFGILTAVVCAVAGSVSLRAEQRRRDRLAAPTFRVRSSSEETSQGLGRSA